jgi:hypothetical protein
MYRARPYAEIKEARQQAILSGAPMIPKGRCHCCDYSVPPKALFCSGVCAEDFEKERAMLTAPVSA